MRYVCPVFKKGSRDCAENYRPVCLTSAVCRLFEKIVSFHINNHLLRNNLISDKQFGFVSKKSCTTQLIMTVNDWFSNMESKICSDCIYIDFRKAFDSVSHRKSKKKLESYGIKGNLLRWLTKFSENRSQQVIIDGSLSTSYPVISGIAQGSCLGPLLFLLYINDLPEVVCNGIEVRMFADDVKMYNFGPLDPDSLQLCLNKIAEWSEIWQLPIAENKTINLRIGRKTTHALVIT